MAIDPARLRQIYVTKGDLVLWDFCSKCLNECSVFDRCAYSKKKDYCIVESKYLKAVTDPVIKELLQNEDGPALTELEWLDFGLKLVPLYQDLIRVKIALAGTEGQLGQRTLTLMREKRQIIRAIDTLEIQKTLLEKFEELGMVPEKDATPEIPPEEEEDETPPGELTQEEIDYLEEYGDPDFAESD